MGVNLPGHVDPLDVPRVVRRGLKGPMFCRHRK
jgi:hypothetical protein